MTMQRGFLAIWCDMAAEDLEDYRNWLTQEHIADRTFSPGFLGVRLFEALDNELSHFILYATENPDVLRGSAYKRILDNPSAWTRQIMPRFGAFDRALGGQVLKVGNGFGSHVAIWRIRLGEGTHDLNRLDGDLAAFAGRDGIVSLRVFAVDHSATERHSEEKTMRRSGEGAFDLLLCAEAMGDQAARVAENRISGEMRRLFRTLGSYDASCRRMIYGEAAHEGPTQ